MERSYGSERDDYDFRDKIMTYGPSEIPSNPKHDLVKYISHVYNQGGLHSCTAHVLCSAYGLELNRQFMVSNNLESMDINKIESSMEIDDTSKNFDRSRLFLYFNSRSYQHNTEKNVSVTFRDAAKAMKQYGVCSETLWPYNELKFSVLPKSICYENGSGNCITKYAGLEQDIDQFRACLSSGSPFSVGFELYSSFSVLENTTSGLMPMPTEDEIRLKKFTLHAALAVGYDDYAKRITLLNSWGKGFGMEGFFFMPYEYILNKERVYSFWKID